MSRKDFTLDARFGMSGVTDCVVDKTSGVFSTASTEHAYQCWLRGRRSGVSLARNTVVELKPRMTDHQTLVVIHAIEAAFKATDK